MPLTNAVQIANMSILFFTVSEHNINMEKDKRRAS
jgi:hypothetical protein